MKGESPVHFLSPTILLVIDNGMTHSVLSAPQGKCCRQDFYLYKDRHTMPCKHDRVLLAQLEALKATTDTKEVSFKIAYGLPISEMLRWGLYISGAASCLLRISAQCDTAFMLSRPIISLPEGLQANLPP